MKKILPVLLSMLLLAGPVYAEQFADSGVTPYFVSDTYFKLYKQPRSTAKVSARLKPGAEISIRQIVDSERIDDQYGSWYEISFDQDGLLGSGYIWSPEMLQNNGLKKDGLKLVYDLQTIAETYSTAITINAVREGRVVATAAAEIYYEAANYIRFTPISGNGLDEVSFVAKLFCSGEACGIPIYEFYYALTTDDKLVKLPDTFKFGGEGINTSYDERLILPAQGAPENTLIKVVATYEPLNADDEYDYSTKDDFATAVYVWDGRQTTLIPQTPVLLNWRDKE